jgi:hypothetical protein
MFHQKPEALVLMCQMRFSACNSTSKTSHNVIRISISAHGSKWTHYRKTYFKMSKNLEQKFCIHIRTYYVRTQFFQKKTFFVSRIKKTILCMNIWLFMGQIFVFFTVATWNVLFCQKLVYEHRMSLPTLRNLFSNFFDILKFIFYAFFIIGSYTPESQNTSSDTFLY